jgi:hypothetical protein
VHLPAPALHLPALRVPELHVPALRSLVPVLPAATLLLSVVYAAAVVVALTAPAEHALPGCVVLAGLIARWAVHRRRSAAATLAGATVAVDAVLPAEGTAAEGSALPVAVHPLDAAEAPATA